MRTPALTWRNWLQRLSRFSPSGVQWPDHRARRLRRPRVERLETRTVPTVTIGANFSGLDFAHSGGYVPPDTCGAAGPSNYVETVNQRLAIYSKASGAQTASDSFSDFLTSQGGLPRTSGGSFSDPIVTYDELAGRFIVGDVDYNGSTHVSNFDLAVSKTNDPTTLTSSSWNFYQISTTESGFDADYPGNFGYNHDAFVFTLNMFGVFGGGHVLITSINSSDLANGVSQAQLHVFKNDLNDFDDRPTTMHDSVANDPMWLVTEHGDNHSIDVIKMTGVLSNSAAFSYTNLPVTPYSGIVEPLNPNGTGITNNIDSRIMKAAEANNTIVATHAVSVSATQDVAQWYKVDVSSGTPVLADQGRVSAGNNTYIYYPGIDINPVGAIGMSYMKSGMDSSTDYMSMWVTGRTTADAAGTMETSVLVPAGTGQANYKDFSGGGRAGDLSGINVDPSDGTFWAANEFANMEASANWGTAVANFSLGTVTVGSADVAVVVSGTSSTTEGNNATYTLTVTNNGPDAAQGVVLTDTLGANLRFASATTTQGSFTQSGSVVTFSLGTLSSGQTVTATVTAQSSEDGNLTDSASVTSTTSDPNTSNNSGSASTTVSEPSINVSGTPITVTVSGNKKRINNVVVAMFTHANGVEPASAFSATIDWGDGTTSAGSITLSGTTYTVSGSHTYKKAGTYTVTTSVTTPEPVREAATPQHPVQQTLTAQQLQPVLQEAIADWRVAGASAAQIALLHRVQVHIAALPSSYLGEEAGDQIWISPNADGWGWFLNASPVSNHAFPASPGSPAHGKMDPLSVLDHELGHVLGLGDSDDLQDVMGETLAAGVRRLPSASDLFAGTAQPPLASVKSVSSSLATTGDHDVATLLANMLATRSQFSPTSNAAPALAAVPYQSQPPVTFDAESGNSKATPSLTQHSATSSTALLDQVFAGIAVKPLDQGIYRGVFSDVDVS